MALVLMKTEDGREVIVHTSVFDSHRHPVLTGEWRDVWAKVDAQQRPQPILEPVAR